METSHKISKEDHVVLHNFLAKHPFSSKIFTKRTDFTVSFAKGEVSAKKTHTFSWPRLLKADSVEEVNKEREELQTNNGVFQHFQVRTNVDVGDQCENIHEVSKVFGDDEKFSIEWKEGQVLLIDFWATWCGPCQNPMKHNQELLHQHSEDWGSKVRIVGLSLDDAKDAVIKRVNERNWKLVDHYFLGGWSSEHNAMRNYQFDGIPFVVLIDTHGKIVYTGHPSSINLEEKINSLLKPVENPDKNADFLQEKAEFKGFSKKMYAEVAQILKNPDFKDANCSLSLSWSKETAYDTEKSGEIVRFSAPKPKFSMSYNIKHEASAKKVEEAVYSVVDKARLDATFSVDNPKAAYEYTVKTLKNELNLHGLQEAQVQFSSSKSFEWYETGFQVEKSKEFSHENVIKPLKNEQVEAFAQSLAKTIEKEDAKKTRWLQNFRLSCKVSKGDDFLPFEVEDVFSEEKVQLKHEENQVLLVDFWATWCGPCQGPMAHNQEMLEKNQEKWGNHVKIVGVSLDQGKEAVKTRVEEKNWKAITHYFLGGNRKGIAPYAVRGIPDVCLVDQQGKIVYRGHPARTKLEENINDLLAGKGICEEKPAEDKKEEKKVQEISREEAKKLAKFLQNPKTAEELKSLLKELKYSPKLEFQLRNCVVFDNELNVKENRCENPVFSLELRKCDKAKLTPFLSGLYEVIAPEKLVEKTELIETVSFSWGKQCEACKKELKPLEPQYYCHWCKVWLCRDCGDKVSDETKQGNDRLLHGCNLVWINISEENGLLDIDEYKLGKNVTYKENCQGFGACCNGCSGGVGDGYRYICLSCRPGPRRPGGFIDICHVCAETLKGKTESNAESYEKIVKTLAENDQHDVKSHLLLRICYGDNYYNY